MNSEKKALKFKDVPIKSIVRCLNNNLEGMAMGTWTNTTRDLQVPIDANLVDKGFKTIPVSLETEVEIIREASGKTTLLFPYGSD